MPREVVRVGDVEPIVLDVSYGDVRPAYEVRASIIEDGVVKYDDGSAFTTTDATLPGTTTSGVWTGEYAFPSYALGKTVFIEARYPGTPLEPDVEERVVMENNTDDVMQAVSAVQGALNG